VLSGDRCAWGPSRIDASRRDARGRINELHNNMNNVSMVGGAVVASGPIVPPGPVHGG
jgi:hypothetical protein